MDQWVKVELESLEKPETASGNRGSRTDSRLCAHRCKDACGLQARLLILCEDISWSLRPEATKSFSDKATSLYDRLIKESAERIVEHASEIPGFSTAFSKASLRADDKIVETLRQQSDQKEVEAREFERRYREADRPQVGSDGTLWSPRMDAIARRQKLSIAYVNLSLSARE